MKRLYFLLGLCLLNFTSFAITVTVNATGAAGSYKTGYTQAATGRTDGNMVIASGSTATPRRGYAVFNLAGVVPPGATVTAVSIRFNYTTSGLGVMVACGIYGFAADLSSVTTPATLFADCSSGTAFNTTNWGASTTGAQDILPFNVTGTTFIQANAGALVSIGFAASTGTNVYTLTGEGGTTLTQPQLQITYTCAGLSGVSATAAPNPVCIGSTLTLTGAATGAASYLWSGPAAFSATTLSTTLTATPAAAGVYTLLAYNAAGCYLPASTAAVTTSAAVPAITGSTLVCGATTLSDASGGGRWSSSASATATVGSSSGVVTGIAPGTATISYITTAGCNTTAIVTVNAVPPPIGGIAAACVGATTPLSDAGGSGVWTSSDGTRAAVNPSTGLVSGIGAGTPTISYTSGACSATVVVTVTAAPAPITGTLAGCPGANTTLSDAAGGGVWTSSNPGVAGIGPATGIVSGVAPGTSVITFGNSCGASVTATMVINSLPPAITGLTTICLGAATTLSDHATPGVWSASPAGIATIGSVTGVVTGVGLGTATVTYTLATSCTATTTVVINPPPAAITGANGVCTGQAVTLAESATGGIWSSSDTTLATISAAGVVTGVSFGDVSITYTAGVSCFLVHTMTVNPLAPILGTDSVCLGLSNFLTNIVGGGVWSSSRPAVAIVDADSGRVTGITPGITVIRYLLPTGCQSTASVSVISFPAAITGTTKACPGTTTALSDVTAGGVWSSYNNGIATVNAATGVVTGISADSVNISYSILPGCAVNTNVTINPLPALITGNEILCPNTTDSLSDLTPGGLWTTHTPSLASVIDTSGIVTALAGGSAVIAYTLPTGCLRTRTLSVNPIPVPVVSYNPYTGTFSTPPLYISYQWYDSIQGQIIGATSPSVAALYTEYYYVVVTDTNGCMGASALFHYDVSQAGVAGIANSSGISIYPNPAGSSIHIAAQVRVRLVISAMDGKNVLEQDDAKDIDISHLADGMYLAGLYDDAGHLLTIQKLAKQ